MEVREGYKLTEVGAIPKDWQLIKMGDLLLSSPDYGLNAPAIEYNSNYPTYLRITDITDDGNYDSTKKVSVHHFLSDNYYLNDNEIVIARTGASVGKSYLFNPQDGNLVFAGFLIRIKPNIHICSSQYLKYYLQTSFYWKWVNVNSMRSGQPGINSTEYASLPVSLPPKPEQEAIAQALSDTDVLIDALRKLIEKKRHIKQGAMQELLTGKRRLPGFEVKQGYKQTEIGEIPEDWEVVTIDDVADVIGGGTPSTTVPNYWNGSINWFTPTEVGSSKYVYTSKRKITDDGLKSSSAKILPVGTILLTSRAGIGDLAILRDEACTNQGFQSLITNDSMDNEYLYYLMATLKNVLLQNASGSTFLEITPTKVRNIEIAIPTLLEQQAIATVLSDMDTEIEALENKLQKTREIKDGMMHELLTGRIRLI